MEGTVYGVLHCGKKKGLKFPKLNFIIIFLIFNIRHHRKIGKYPTDNTLYLYIKREHCYTLINIFITYQFVSDAHSLPQILFDKYQTVYESQQSRLIHERVRLLQFYHDDFVIVSQFLLHLYRIISIQKAITCISKQVNDKKHRI